MELYHFTSALHWQVIANQGKIETTDSVLDVDPMARTPRVVWLTTDPEPTTQGWADPSSKMLREVYGLSKTQLRIAVNGDTLNERQLHHWPAWSAEHGIEQWWYDSLADAGGDSEAWWVYVEGTIKFKHWYELVQTTNGEVIWTPDMGHPKRARVFIMDTDG